jgi:hypothetical protein
MHRASLCLQMVVIQLHIPLYYISPWSVNMKRNCFGSAGYKNMGQAERYKTGKKQ